jgi:hypothetical protein
MTDSDLKEGIYLQEKPGRIGSGITARDIVYKNYYAVRLDGLNAEMFLLDDELTLTGLRERIPLKKLSEDYQYQPQHTVRFQVLNTSLGPRPKSPASPPSAPVVAASHPVSAAPKSPAKAEAPAGWWDMTRLGAEKLVKKKG